MNTLKSFLVHKNVWLIFLSCWIAVALPSLVFINSAELISGVLLAGIGLPFLIKSRGYYYSKSKPEGKRLFFSKLGYIMFGVCLGLVVLATIFNLAYQPGWFNFTDLGFVLLSYPLATLTHFQPDSYDSAKRLMLYVIDCGNLIGIIFISDIVGLLLGSIYRKIKDIISTK